VGACCWAVVWVGGGLRRELKKKSWLDLSVVENNIDMKRELRG